MMGSLVEEDKKIFSELLYVTALRGDDSTGVVAVDISPVSKVERYRTLKEAQSAEYWLWKDSRANNKILNPYLSDIILGHCRSATVGSVTVQNAHPFDTGKYISAHNGTLIDRRYEHKELTDSEMMFKDIEERGIKKVLEGLSAYSAFAISMYEKNTGKVILARNTHRPLHIALSKQRDVMYWCSEDRMLDFVQVGFKQDWTVLSLRPGVIYTFDLNDIAKDNETPWEEEEIDLAKVSSRISYSMSGDWDTFGSYGTGSEIAPWYADELEQGPLGVTVPKKPWDFECSICDDVIPIHDVQDSKIEFSGGVVYMCQACQFKNGSDRTDRPADEPDVAYQ